MQNGEILRNFKLHATCTCTPAPVTHVLHFTSSFTSYLGMFRTIVPAGSLEEMLYGLQYVSFLKHNACTVYTYLLERGVSVGRIYRVGKRSKMWRYSRNWRKPLPIFPLAHVASLSKINIVKLKTASPRDRLRMWVRRLRPTDRVWVRHSLAMLAFAFGIDRLRNCTTIDFV